MAKDDKAYLVIEMQKQADGSLAHLVDAFTDRNTAEQKYHSSFLHPLTADSPLQRNHW